MQTKLRLTGTARQVFRYLALLAKANPTMKVKDLKGGR